ncbi:MAG: CDP-glycerol glycerophosphotransferase family protein [Chloroflexota bacterium]
MVSVKAASQPEHTIQNTFEPSTAGPVLFLCHFFGGIRNVVHSGMINDVRAHGLPAHLLASKTNLTKKRFTAATMTVQSKKDTQPVDGNDEEHRELKSPPVTSNLIKLYKPLLWFQEVSYFRRNHLERHRLQAWWEQRDQPVWRQMRYAMAESLGILGSQQPFYGWLNGTLEWIKHRSWDIQPAREQMNELKPSVVVATSCGSESEEPYLWVAHQMGIPTLGCILNLDSLNAHSFIPACDHYMVWSQHMKDELLAYYPNVPVDHVHATGMPQFDFHAREEFRWTREETLKRLGLKPGDKYILYATGRQFYTPKEPELFEEFSRKCAETPELKAHKIVVRPHPMDELDRWDRFATADGRIVVSRPSAEAQQFAGPEDQALLVNTCYHADVCTNFFSTMSLDAAAVDTPVVCIAFAAEKDSQEDRYSREYYEMDYYKPIVASGGVRMAYDMDQLMSEIVAYVQDRSRDKAERSKLVVSECGPVDGKAAERIADLIAVLAADYVKRGKA